MEPIDGPIAKPPGGWPIAVMRLVILETCPLAHAVYEAAGAARLWRRGVVIEWAGAELTAWPHQTTSEIARAFERERTMRAA